MSTPSTRVIGRYMEGGWFYSYLYINCISVVFRSYFVRPKGTNETPVAPGFFTVYIRTNLLPGVVLSPKKLLPVTQMSTPEKCLLYL